MIGKKNKDWKKKKFDEVKSLKDRYESFIFFNFNGLDVPKMVQLRDSMKEIGNETKVTKNVFIKMIFGIKFEDPTGIIAVKDDPIKSVKVLLKLIDEGKIKGSLVAGKFFSAGETVSFKKMPDLSEVRALVVGTLIGTLYRLISSLLWYPSSLIYILKQRAEKQD